MTVTSSHTTAILLSLTVCLLTAGCQCEDSGRGAKTGAPADQGAETTTGASAEGGVEEPKQKPTGKQGHRMPIGPRLIVQPGKGVSAIFFGATAETIERHMQAPCDIRTETRCAYVKQAVDFRLKDGVLNRIHIHRRNHEVPGSDEPFGMFRGILPPTIMLGLHRHVVLEEYGEPEKKETIDPPGKHGLVERHHYDGLILEYDLLENGNTVLSKMEVYPSETAESVTIPVPAESGNEGDAGE